MPVMTEYEKRRLEIEKKKLKVLNGILFEISKMNMSPIEKAKYELWDEYTMANKENKEASCEVDVLCDQEVT